MATFKQHLFDAELNPAISWLQHASLQIFMRMPDLSRSTAVRVFGFVYAAILLAWLIAEGITVYGVLTRILLMAIFFGVAYAKTIAGIIWVFLFKWEKFKYS